MSEHDEIPSHWINKAGIAKRIGKSRITVDKLLSKIEKDPILSGRLNVKVIVQGKRNLYYYDPSDIDAVFAETNKDKKSRSRNVNSRSSNSSLNVAQHVSNDLQHQLELEQIRRISLEKEVARLEAHNKDLQDDVVFFKAQLTDQRSDKPEVNPDASMTAEEVPESEALPKSNELRGQSLKMTYKGGELIKGSPRSPDAGDERYALAVRLRYLRRRYNWKQSDAAQKINWNTNSYGDIELLRKRVHTSDLLDLSKGFGVSVQWLMTGEAVGNDLTMNLPDLTSEIKTVVAHAKGSDSDVMDEDGDNVVPLTTAKEDKAIKEAEQEVREDIDDGTLEDVMEHFDPMNSAELALLDEEIEANKKAKDISPEPQPNPSEEADTQPSEEATAKEERRNNITSKPEPVKRSLWQKIKDNW